MKRRPHTYPGYVINTFFLIGLVSAMAFRSIIVFQRLQPAWVRPVWYVGVLGYVGFFLYRYGISRKRKKAIQRYRLIEKVQANACLTDDDREVVTYLLTSIRKSHEDMNYFAIFLFSILAIALDVAFSIVM